MITPDKLKTIGFCLTDEKNPGCNEYFIDINHQRLSYYDDEELKPAERFWFGYLAAGFEKEDTAPLLNSIEEVQDFIELHSS